MRRMDELHRDYPFAGSRMLRDLLRNEGRPVGRKRIRRLMRQMGIEALYRKPNTSRRHAAHPIYPYRLRNLNIERPNHVWASDITYIPMRRGFVYLVAIVDWCSRRVLAWRLSNTLTTDFCIEALQEAITRYGAPEIFNTDQGSQFTSTEFTGALLAEGVRISMDGKGRATDNAFIERLWRTVKQQCIYRNAPSDGHELHRILSEFFAWYNHHRPHQELDGLTPARLYLGLPDNRPRGIKPTLKQSQHTLTLA